MKTTKVILGNEELTARLDFNAFMDIENRLGTNPLNILLEANSGKLPKVTDLLTVIQGSCAKLTHGLTMQKVISLWEKDINEGKGINDLITIVITILREAGYLGKEESEQTD